MNIPITDRIALTEIRPTDRLSLVEHLNDREIYTNTLRIPSPYTDADADKFLEVVRVATKEHGGPVHFAIRESEAGLIGGCGFDGLSKVTEQNSVIGWLELRRGQGVTTAAIGALRDYALEQWQLVRISAYVFTFNVASARVLEKNRFACEGTHRKLFRKDGRFLDSRAYAFVR